MIHVVVLNQDSPSLACEDGIGSFADVGLCRTTTTNRQIEPIFRITLHAYDDGVTNTLDKELRREPPASEGCEIDPLPYDRIDRSIRNIIRGWRCVSWMTLNLIERDRCPRCRDIFIETAKCNRRKGPSWNAMTMIDMPGSSDDGMIPMLAVDVSSEPLL